jgi:hypothetical protein
MKRSFCFYLLPNQSEFSPGADYNAFHDESDMDALRWSHAPKAELFEDRLISGSSHFRAVS